MLMNYRERQITVTLGCEIDSKVSKITENLSSVHANPRKFTALE